MSAKVDAYLEKHGIPVRKKNVVKVNVDAGCKMAEVRVNNKVVMLGNFWDFHPGCHGIDLRFQGHDSLADVFVKGMPNAELRTNPNWQYKH